MFYWTVSSSSPRLYMYCANILLFETRLIRKNKLAFIDWQINIVHSSLLSPENDITVFLVDIWSCLSVYTSMFAPDFCQAVEFDYWSHGFHPPTCTLSRNNNRCWHFKCHPSFLIGVVLCLVVHCSMTKRIDSVVWAVFAVGLMQIIFSRCMSCVTIG